MNWNEFEKRLADGLNEYESQLDVEAIIEAIRKKQKQKRRIIWSLFLPVIAIGLAGLYFAHLGDQNIGLASNGIYQSDILEQKSSGKQIYDEQNKESSKSKQGDYKRNKKLSNFSSVVNGNKLFAGSTNFKSKQSKNLNLNLHNQISAQLNAITTLEKEFNESCPYPIYPELGGLLPWGITDNGDVMFWIANGEPDSWKIVVHESRGTMYEMFETTLTNFLIDLSLERIVSKIIPIELLNRDAQFKSANP